MLKKAMIMAAGVGSRLEPLSSVVPKPLVPLANIPTMDIIIKHLSSFGIKDIIANTYYKAEIIQEHYKRDNLGSNIEFIKEQELSGTAGGVKKCQFFFDKNDDFIIMSGDGLTDIDIEKAYVSHIQSNSIATIVTKDIPHEEVYKYGIIVTDENGYVKSFQEKPKKEEAKSNLANTGIYIFNYKIFDYIPENTFYDFAKNVFPALLANNVKINTYTHYGYWSDIGSIEQYKQSNIDILKDKVQSVKLDRIETKLGCYISPKKIEIKDNTNIEGYNVIGKNCKIGENCTIKNSVIWDNVEIKNNVKIENSIILPNIIVEQSVNNEILSDRQFVNV